MQSLCLSNNFLVLLQISTAVNQVKNAVFADLISTGEQRADLFFNFNTETQFRPETVGQVSYG